MWPWASYLTLLTPVSSSIQMSAWWVYIFKWERRPNSMYFLELCEHWMKRVLKEWYHATYKVECVKLLIKYEFVKHLLSAKPWVSKCDPGTLKCSKDPFRVLAKSHIFIIVPRFFFLSTEFSRIYTTCGIQHVSAGLDIKRDLQDCKGVLRETSLRTAVLKHVSPLQVDVSWDEPVGGGGGLELLCKGPQLCTSQRWSHDLSCMLFIHRS